MPSRRTKSATLPGEVNPQRRKADKAEPMADTEAVAMAERERYLLSLRYPKIDETMPVMLGRVSGRVAEI